MRTKLTIVLVLITTLLRAQPAPAYSVVIDEIMADPDPPVALPNAEYVELRNTSKTTIDLRGWQLGDNNGFATVRNSFLLSPDSTVILCSTSALPLLSAFGQAIALPNFPSLNNDGKELVLRASNGKTVHAVAYSADWYHNPAKNSGGWSLEMIDVHNPCSGASNWTASTDPRGGSPGKINATDGNNPDTDAPALLDAWVPDSLHIFLRFSEGLDSNTAAQTAAYDVPGLTVQQAQVIPPFFDLVLLTLSALVQNDQIYTITTKNITDCAGNTIVNASAAKCSRTRLPAAAQVVINEVMFNPKPDGFDYFEIYNRSTAVINLKDVWVSTRNGQGNLTAAIQVSTIDRLLFPGDYRVFCENPSALQRQYLVKFPEAILPLRNMPSMPDDRGSLVLLNINNKIIDELNYDAHWQFPLLTEKEGVALERIDYNKPAQLASNWHSAAETAGFGTPGYQNSQYTADGLNEGAMTVYPRIVSPDNDGNADYLTIAYRFSEPGYVCNISIFDLSGKPVRYLTHNALCGRDGMFRWDGLSEQQQPLAIGVYLVICDVFNLQGKTRRYKFAVTLARKF
ncbi:MAG: lamin tail domain-containing protein [Bacteroidota bacterium]|nr:lamin tail domain-containing protein [Bacteroidota bacterium]